MTPVYLSSRLEIAETGAWGTDQAWEITKSFVVRWGGKVLFQVPKGFRTDLASVPQLAKSLVPKLGPWNQIAVVHDFVYRNPWVNLTRKEADDLLMDGMKTKNVGLYARSVIYSGVRAGGWASYKARTHGE